MSNPDHPYIVKEMYGWGLLQPGRESRSGNGERIYWIWTPYKKSDGEIQQPPEYALYVVCP